MPSQRSQSVEASTRLCDIGSQTFVGMPGRLSTPKVSELSKALETAHLLTLPMQSDM